MYMGKTINLEKLLKGLKNIIGQQAQDIVVGMAMFGIMNESMLV